MTIVCDRTDHERYDSKRSDRHCWVAYAINCWWATVIDGGHVMAIIECHVPTIDDQRWRALAVVRR